MLYAGFDCSTQSLSVAVIEVTGSRKDVIFRDALSFDADLPEFNTRHGVTVEGPGGVVHAPPLLWATALERMLGRLSSAVDGRRLRAISGSAQQHGSVYCGAAPDILTRPTSPIWMDTSTAAECAEIERALGGPRALARLTGSRAFPRFTGPQIRKFAREDPPAYAATQKIHLVSSYLASLLLGAHGSIDHADGSGMNLMDLRTRSWSDAAVTATAPGLAAKLPPLVASAEVLGALATRWREALGLPPVKIIAWSGDNPCSLVGTGVVNEGQLAISLGTSDTIFGPMREPRVSADGTGHVFASPTGEYMGITVFRNGSLARERVRDRLGLDWQGFSDALASTPPGNGGALMLPWFEPEITPAVTHPVAAEQGLHDRPPAARARAIVESQMMAMLRHSAWMGLRPTAIHATGGAAANRGMLQVMADVFASPVHYSPPPMRRRSARRCAPARQTRNGRGRRSLLGSPGCRAWRRSCRYLHM
jgi:xylulokinase